jgi:hypothetical protein
LKLFWKLSRGRGEHELSRAVRNTPTNRKIKKKSWDLASSKVKELDFILSKYIEGSGTLEKKIKL